MTTIATTDTVERALQTPEQTQPWAELGLKEDEYARIRQILDRRPTSCELAMYSVMWSEHCSYKSSKIHLKRFSELESVTESGPLLAGIGDNAGVIDIGDGWAVTFKIESHNHPSYVEPYQGAATGVGGIVRDILAMGARPIGVMDSLRFGPLDAPDTARVAPGVVAGVGGYGNCLGLPNIGGEVVFDACYAGNPLVNALCVGVLRHEHLHLAHATGVGNQVILYGARTGGDGIGGASILASETFTDGGPTKRPAVQVGDPFMEKLLIECTLELFQAGVVSALQDFGAAGLSCATSELASAGDGGMHVDLDAVPLRDSSLRPEEILMSESQERMMAIVRPEDVERFMEICAKWDVLATTVGEVTDGDRLVIDWHGERVVDVDPKTVAHDGPTYDRPIARPGWIDTLQADGADHLVRPESGEELAAAVLALAGSPNLCDTSWVTNQYDRFVLGNTVLAQPQDSGMLRIDEQTRTGIALAVDGNSRYTYLDPARGAQIALVEAYRNVCVTGARPQAITDCLNFGSPEDPEIMWQFTEAIDGLIEGCRALGTPVTGGNVSFYNKTGEQAIQPTPVIGMLGLIDDVANRVPGGFTTAGDIIYLLGETSAEFDGSRWAEVAHGHLGGRPPAVDFDHHRRLAAFFDEAARAHLLSSAHDLSDGGLAIALVEECLRRHLGAEIALPGDAFTALFSESTGRVLVSAAPEQAEVIAEAAARHGLPLTVLGHVLELPALTVVDQFTLSLDDLHDAWAAPLPEALGAHV
ncbi:MAG: phosphoribosylformylglycinamidine synthase subunit PurL [Propionibacteriaceae bacterium]|jgi:phosphoribosylformylglycinamidine synthase|nr:phosphoribosylformylglycinamidine synthase subunit PurL [Propionibacteriaceae bacterium]